MLKHHADSIENMIEHYRADAEIYALFLIGSVATGTARPDSDIDAVAIISSDAVAKRRAGVGLEEVCHGKCTYEGGYFDLHYMDAANLHKLAQSGSEPMRNMFTSARALYCFDDTLPEIVTQIPVFQRAEAPAKKLRHYCTMKMFHTYFWKTCKPEGFMRHHVACGMVNSLYRLILLENEILFPSMRKLEETAAAAAQKPADAIRIAGQFLQSLTDADAAALVSTYETWTTYDYPKEHSVVMNNFANPLEWQ